MRPRNAWLANAPPCFDARLELKGSSELHANCLHVLCNAGVIHFVSERRRTLAPFFVAKRDGCGKRRMALDTRRVIRMRFDPDVAELPTVGVGRVCEWRLKVAPT